MYVCIVVNLNFCKRSMYNDKYSSYVHYVKCMIDHLIEKYFYWLFYENMKIENNTRKMIFEKKIKKYKKMETKFKEFKEKTRINTPDLLWGVSLLLYFTRNTPHLQKYCIIWFILVRIYKHTHTHTHAR